MFLKCINNTIYQDVKYSSTQYIVPGSKVWRIPALCYDLNLGMIFYFDQDFSGSIIQLTSNFVTRLIFKLKNKIYFFLPAIWRYMAVMALSKKSLDIFLPTDTKAIYQNLFEYLTKKLCLEFRTKNAFYVKGCVIWNISIITRLRDFSFQQDNQ